MKKLIRQLTQRLKAACLTLPTVQAGLWAIGLLVAFGLVYLPIGLSSGFLKWEIQSSVGTMIGVGFGTFWMPGLIEELLFRALLIPHPTETVTPTRLWLMIGVSWVGFLLYHLNLAAPAFFREPIFLLGAALIGTVCTIAYLRSGSIWLPVVMHWLIVLIWLLALGGLAKFQ
jgi:uncharacterized protein